VQLDTNKPKTLNQGGEPARRIFGLREHLIWPASEYSLSNLEYKIASKRSSMIKQVLRQ